MAVDCIWALVDVRRCRFIASDPPAPPAAPPAPAPPIRLVGDILNALGIELVVEDLGLPPVAASFGPVAPPLREAL